MGTVKEICKSSMCCRLEVFELNVKSFIVPEERQESEWREVSSNPFAVEKNMVGAGLVLPFKVRGD